LRSPLGVPCRPRTFERKIPGIGNSTPDQLFAVSQKSCDVLYRLGPKIQWLQSYVTADKIYHVSITPDEKTIREHGKQGDFPANRIAEVTLIVDATTAES
jgi:hypothetical protein